MNAVDIIKNILNDQQRQAANSTSKYLQITAGPGTGKTSTLAARILNLQYERGMLCNEVLAISFSRAAKQQLVQKMKDYTEKLGHGNVIEVLTFHSLAHRIIRYGVHHGEAKFNKGFQTINTIDFITTYPSLIEGLCTDVSDRLLVGEALAQVFNMVRQGQKNEWICENL
jgi:DNA helicase-2/ATP-dependent DNA helicase PcrA